MTFKERATNLFLLAITFVGGFLVSEQIISGEQLAEVQGVTGMALAGGGLTLSTILYTLKVLVPKNAIDSLVAKVGQEKVDNAFETINKLNVEFGKVVNELNQVKAELQLYREEREQIKQDLNL